MLLSLLITLVNTKRKGVTNMTFWNKQIIRTMETTRKWDKEMVSSKQRITHTMEVMLRLQWMQLKRVTTRIMEVNLIFHRHRTQ